MHNNDFNVPVHNELLQFAKKQLNDSIMLQFLYVVEYSAII